MSWSKQDKQRCIGYHKVNMKILKKRFIIIMHNKQTTSFNLKKIKYTKIKSTIFIIR